PLSTGRRQPEAIVGNHRHCTPSKARRDLARIFEIEGALVTNILDAVNDPKLFARWFKDPATWERWFAFLAALFNLPMTAEQLAHYQQCTNRPTAATEAIKQAWLICGRRFGKSFMLALVAVFLACFHDYQQYLSPGERGTILILAKDRRQARTIF